MEELENKMVQEELEHHINFDEYDKEMEVLAEIEDKRWEDNEND